VLVSPAAPLGLRAQLLPAWLARHKFAAPDDSLQASDPVVGCHCHTPACLHWLALLPAALFSFFIFKKNQNFKNICPF